MTAVRSISFAFALIGALLLTSPLSAMAKKERGEQTLKATIVEVDNTPGRGSITVVTDDGRTLILPQVTLRSEQFRVGYPMTIINICKYYGPGNLVCQGQYDTPN